MAKTAFSFAYRWKLIKAPHTQVEFKNQIYHVFRTFSTISLIVSPLVISSLQIIYFLICAFCGSCYCCGSLRLTSVGQLGVAAMSIWTKKVALRESVSRICDNMGSVYGYKVGLGIFTLAKLLYESYIRCGAGHEGSGDSSLVPDPFAFIV